MPNTDLMDLLTIAELAPRIKAREVSPVVKARPMLIAT